MSIELERVNNLLRHKSGTPWAEMLSPVQLTAIQTNGSRVVSDWKPVLNAIQQACERGDLPCTTTSTETTYREPPPPPDLMRMTWETYEAEKKRSEGRFGPLRLRKTVHRHIKAADFAQWLAAQGEAPSQHAAAWFKSQGVNTATAAQPAPETKEQRQNRRLQLCIDAGLPMTRPNRLPDGVALVAVQDGVSRQTFSEDVREALKRKIERERPKPRLVSTKKH